MTIAFYGPDDKFASKIAVGIVTGERQAGSVLERWHSEETDIRGDHEVAEAISRLIERHGAKTVAVSGIIGCPHEEGVDYEGEVCPRCPFWADRDRWTGEVTQ